MSNLNFLSPLPPPLGQYEDYTVSETLMELEFGQCRTQVCVNPFTIINDQKVEDVQTFDLFIRSRDRNLVRADPNIAQVTILDDAESELITFDERGRDCVCQYLN